MYLRPGSLPKDFWVERLEVGRDAIGRPEERYLRDGAVRIRGVLAGAKPEERERWSQTAHPVTHTITQRGRPAARAGDRLIHGSRVFYIQGVDHIGDLGIATLYYAEERVDLDGNSYQLESGE